MGGTIGFRPCSREPLPTAPSSLYAAAMADTALMPIPGQMDPVPVARDITPRADGRVDLLGLPHQRIAELLAEAGLDARQAKLRAKQVFHWLYHRGVTDFEAMTDIAKASRPWLGESNVIGRH